MLRRLLIGLIEGLVVGAAFALPATRLLGLTSPSGLVAALLGALAGFVVGLVAGRPIWARDAKTEAFLKGAAGALGGFGLSFALRRWLKLELDLSAFSLGVGPAGALTAVALPVAATALALFFELDDDGARGSQPKQRQMSSTKQRVDLEAPPAADLDNEQEATEHVDHQREKH